MPLCHHRKDGRGCGVHVDQLQVADPDLGPRRPRLHVYAQAISTELTCIIHGLVQARVVGQLNKT